MGRGKFSRIGNSILVTLLLVALVPVAPAFAQDTSPIYTIKDCQQVDEELLLGDLNHIVRSVLETEKSGLDVGEIVRRNWIELNLDSVVDTAVDDAVEKVREEKGTWARIFSGWSEGKAREFAESVAENAFGSAEFRDAIDLLSLNVVDDLEVEISVMTIKSASSALLCVQEFIGTTFSKTMSLVLEDNIRERVTDVDSRQGEKDIDMDALGDHGASLAGLGIIVGAQIAKLLAKKVAQGILGKVVTRILGKAASAVVPVAGWIIGGALLIFDLYQAWEGSLPQIRKDFKGENVKETIRQEITDVVEDELNSALPELSQEVTIDIYRQWKSFLQKFDHILRLAETNARFRTIVDGVTADKVKKLSELVVVGDEVLGTEWLGRIIETGDFERILALPKASFVILEEKADPDLVLAWADLAGESIVHVVETELYKHSSPTDLGSRETLEHVLALSIPIAIEKLMRLSDAERGSLLRLPTPQAKWILTELSAEELYWLAAYLSGLTTQSQVGLVDFVIRDLELISLLRGSEELQSNFSIVLTFAEASPRLKTILNGTTAEQVEKLSALGAVASGALEPDQLSAMIEAGQFEEILVLPQATFEILREKKDPSLVIAWAALAGKTVVQVVETGLFRVATPSDFSGNDTLAQVIALENHEAIRKLMLLDRTMHNVLLKLPTVQARAVLIALQVEDLSWLGGYLPELTNREAGLITDFILQEPGLLHKLRVSENLHATFPGVLTFAESNPGFKDILNGTGIDGVEKLSELVAIADESLTPEQLASAVATGQFERIFVLPEATFEILKEKKDPAVVIAWADLSREEVGKVVETELYRVASPSDFSGRDALRKVLALEDPAAIRKLMQLHKIERVVLLGLATVRARSALDALSMEDLSWLALYLAELAADEKDPVVEYILREHGLISLLKDKENVRTRFPRLLMLGLSNPRFEEILYSQSVDELEKLSELVAAADATMAPEQLAEMLETDQFERILALPQNSFDILRVTGDPALVLNWAELAGLALNEVVETGLYLVAPPSALHGRDQLNRVLAIETPIAIQRLMNLEQDDRDALLELPPEEARATLMSDLSKEELSWLAAYLPHLPNLAQKILAFYAVREPKLITKLRGSEDLRVNLPHVLNLALSFPHFRNVLNGTSVEEVERLSELVVVGEEALGSERLAEMIELGQFELILALPESAFTILKWSRNPALVIAWADLAGSAIDEVVETELYVVATPDNFGHREELNKVLALQNSKAVEAFMQLSQKDRTFLLSVLEVKELTWLITFIPELSHEETVLLGEFLEREPVLMTELDAGDTRQALLESRDKEAVLEFLSLALQEAPPVWPTLPMLSAAEAAFVGEVPPTLYWQYYATPSLTLLSVLVVLIVMALSSWWLIRRQRSAKSRVDRSRPKRG